MSKERRQYTDEFRAEAVVLLMAAGYPDKKGSLTATANQLGIHARTLSRWAKGEQNPPPDQTVTEKKANIGERLDQEMDAIFEQMKTTRAKANYQQLATAFAIMFDKRQLVLNKPTAIQGDWRSQAIEDIKAGVLSYEALEENFDESLAADLFRAAGVPIPSR